MLCIKLDAGGPLNQRGGGCKHPGQRIKWEQIEQNMGRKQHGFLLLEGVGGGEREGWEDNLW